MKNKRSPIRPSTLNLSSGESPHRGIISTNKSLTTHSILRRSSSHISPSPSSSPSQTQGSTYTNENITATNSLKRKYSSFSSSASPSRPSLNTILSRSDTFSSDYEQGNSRKWTTEHWKKLEKCYVRNNRNYEEAAKEFYYQESLQGLLPDRDPTDDKLVRDEFWSKEQILWRSKCLDTNTRFYNGVLPSERKKLKPAPSNSSPPSPSTFSHTFISPIPTTSIDSTSTVEKSTNFVNNKRL